MTALLRLVVFGFIALSVIYLWVSLTARARQRRALRAEWDEKGLTGDRDAFVMAGMRIYERSLRHRLIVLIYVIPVIAVGALIYITNYT